LAELPDDELGLWCSQWCRSVNAKTRYWRAVLCDGRIEDPAVHSQVQMDMAFLLAGGYSALGRNPSPKTREIVLERDNGLCQSCGEPGNQVDHIEGNSDDPSNLQVLCEPCHRLKTFESFEPAGDESRTWVMILYLTRVEPEEPRLLADDVVWREAWARLKAERKARFDASLIAIGFEAPPRLSRKQVLAARDEFIASDGASQRRAPNPNALRDAEESLRAVLRDRSSERGDWFFRDLMSR